MNAKITNMLDGTAAACDDKTGSFTERKRVDPSEAVVLANDGYAAILSAGLDANVAALALDALCKHLGYSILEMAAISLAAGFRYEEGKEHR